MIIKDNNAFLMATGSGSSIKIFAADQEKKSFVNLDRTAHAGDTTIYLTEATGWEVGDKIAISSTSYDYSESEVARIIEVNSTENYIIIEAPLTYEHLGDTIPITSQSGSWEVKLKAEVSLLSRNVKINGSDSSIETGYGGHTVVMNDAVQMISGVELERMGQIGTVGRYPIHWHSLKDDGEGQFLRNSSIHSSFNKGVTIHDTNLTTIEGNVVYNTIGHGFFFEDGSETGNTLIGNISYGQNAAATLSSAPIASDFSHPTSFWVTNPNNNFIDNVAAGSQGSGFWFTAEEGVSGISLDSGDYENYSPMNDKVGTIKGITSHSNGHFGFAMGWSIQDDGSFKKGPLLANWDSHGNLVDFTVSDIQLYRSMGGKDLNEGGAQLWVRALGGTFSNAVISDGAVGAVLRGYQTIENSLFLGSTNTDAQSQHEFLPRAGIQLYDEPFHVTGTLFQNYYGDQDAAFSIQNGVSASSNYSFSNLEFINVREGGRFSGRTYAEGRMDMPHTTARAILDIDGSTFGQIGAIITPVIFDSESDGINVLTPGFNAYPNAILSQDGRSWINDPGAKIGILQINGIENAVVTRSDAPAISLRSDSQILAFSHEELKYEISSQEWDTQGARLRIKDFSIGESIEVRLKNVPAEISIGGAYEVSTLEELANAEATSFLREGPDLIAKIVAMQQSRWPASPANELAEKNFIGSVSLVDSNNIGTWRPSFKSTGVTIVDGKGQNETDLEHTEGSTESLANPVRAWSDVRTWLGHKPKETDIVIIDRGEHIILDESINVAGIIISGERSTLSIEDNQSKSIDVTTDWLLVIDGGTFQAGSEVDPLDTNLNITLAGDDPNLTLNIEEILSDRAGDSRFISPIHWSNGSPQIGDSADNRIIGYGPYEYIFGGDGDDLIFSGNTEWGYANKVGLVSSLFVTLLGREPSLAGLEFFLDRLESGLIDEERLIQTIVHSSEFVKKTEILPKEQFLDYIFENAFSRRPTLSEIYSLESQAASSSEMDLLTAFVHLSEFWDLQLKSGLHLVHHFSNSESAMIASRAMSVASQNQISAESIFETISNARSRGSIMDEILSAVSFEISSSNLSHMSDEEFIDSIFLSSLGRSPSEGGRGRLLDFISGGGDRAEVVIMISNSKEFIYKFSTDVTREPLEASGGSLLIGGNGEDTLVSGAFQDTFVFNKLDMGGDKVFNFDSEDKIVMLGDYFDTPVQNLSQRGSSVFLDIDGQEVEFIHSSLLDFSEDTFIFYS